jgi:hypothetical protein
LENSRFAKVGIFDDKRKVKKYTYQAQEILHKIKLILENKYDDPEDPEIPHLNISDPFVILQHSPINYAELFKKYNDKISEEQSKSTTCETKQKGKIH